MTAPAAQQTDLQRATISEDAEAAMRAVLGAIVEAVDGAEDRGLDGSYIAALAAAYESLCKGEQARPTSLG